MMPIDGSSQQQEVLCRNGCGFFGSAEWQGNCSRCWTGMTASEKLDSMAATQQEELLKEHMSSTQDASSMTRVTRKEQKNPHHTCSYCRQKFTGDPSRFRTHLWNHQQKVRKFWYAQKAGINQVTGGINKFKRKYYKKRPNPYIFLWKDPSVNQGFEGGQDGMSWDTANEEASEDSFADSANLKCRFCEALFTSDEQLNEHEKFHARSRPYTCLICGQSFKIRGHLARHEVIHQRNEKHACDFCNATFAKTSQLKVHRVIHLMGDNQNEDFPELSDPEEPKPVPKIVPNKRKKVKPLKIVLGQKFSRPKLEVPAQQEIPEEEQLYEQEIYDIAALQSIDIDYIQKKAIEQRGAGIGGKMCQYCSKRCASARDLMEHERKHTGEKPHKCPICSMKTARKSDLTKHMRTMHPTVQCVRCNVCDALFTSQNQLEIHQQVHLNSSGSLPSTYSVGVNGMVSMTQPQVYPLALTTPKLQKQKSPVGGEQTFSNKSRMYPQTKPRLACQYCPRVYTIRRDLVEHERTHTGEKPYKCAKCPQRFHRKSNFFRHRQICKGAPSPKMESSQMFGCFYCEDMFPDQHSLLKHQRSHTPAKTSSVAEIESVDTDSTVGIKKGLDRVFPCKYCHKRFLNRAGLVVHEKSHKGTYTHKCRHCGKRFLTKSGLATHENMHLRNKSRVGKVEDFLNNSSTLTENDVEVQPNVDAAEYADQESTAVIKEEISEQVSEHYAPAQTFLLPSCDVKVNEKVQAYKCRYCSKVCGKYANLLVHERLHTHGNRYKCKKCGKGFDVRRRLKQHENTHKEYICQFCTKSFLRHLQLVRHIKSAHKTDRLSTQISTESSHGKYKPGNRGLLCMYCGYRFCRKNKRVLSHMRSHRKRYGKHWYIKAANFVPVVNYPAQTLEVKPKVKKPAALAFPHVIPYGNTGPFKCRFCEKVCSRKMYLEQHEVIHTANRRFQCNTCGLKFCKLYQLTRHKKKAHKGSKAVPKMFVQDEEESDLQDYQENYDEDFPELEDYTQLEEYPELEQEDYPDLEDHHGDQDTSGQDVEKSHICHFCNAVCDTRENLLSHEKSHGPEGELTYTCKYCPMTFFRRTEYERHERTHTGERPYICGICGKAFNRTWNLKIHRLNVHGVRSSRGMQGELPPPQLKPIVTIKPEEPPVVDGRFACKQCGKHLSSEWSLRVHERTHTKDSLHHCRVCGMGFTRQWNLKQHLQSVHRGRADAKTCNICDKEFANPSNLRKHLKQVHMVKNPFVSKYSLPADLPADSPAATKQDGLEDEEPPPIPRTPSTTGLIKTQNLFSLKCDKCGKRFRDNIGLRKHKITFCGGGRRQCHICKQAFSNSSNLNRHILSHTGEKPFQCDICGRGFFQSTHLTRHMSLHSGRRPFACNLCKSSFSSQALLDSHKVSHAYLDRDTSSSLPVKEEEIDVVKNYKTPMNLSRKRREVHKCLYCASICLNEAQLKSHERAHLIELPFRCQTCFKLFETSAILEEHTNTEHTARPQVTKIIPDEMEPHIDEVSPSREQEDEEDDRKPKICKYCSKALPGPSELKRHLFLVHNKVAPENKPPPVKREVIEADEAGKVYPCVLCRKNFSSSSNRSRHFRIFHKGKKTFPAVTASVKHVDPPPAAIPIPGFSPTKYYCHPCQRSYSSSGNLSKHRRIHHGLKPKTPSHPGGNRFQPDVKEPPVELKPVVMVDGVKKYVCHMCNKSFSNSGNLSRHKRLFHNQKPTMTNILGNLLQGQKVAAAASSPPQRLNPSPAYSPSAQSISAHSSPIHSPPRSPRAQHQAPASAVSPRSKGGKFSCNMCDRTFTQSTNLSRHKRNFHGVKPRIPFPVERAPGVVPKKKPKVESSGVKFGCLYCHEMFSLKSALIAHQATHDATKSSFMCQHCDLTFSDSEALVAHEKLHMEQEKSVECRFCGQTFTNRGGLAMHERSHKGDKRYQCRQCYKTFFNKAGLMSHERCHAVEADEDMLEDYDDLPEKRSRSDSDSSGGHNGQSINHSSSSPQDERAFNLARTHDSMLDQARPHGCEWCDKRFLTTTDLKRHIRTHTGEQPYPCPHCPKRFSQSQNLKKHLFVIHKQGMPLASWNLSETQINSHAPEPVREPERKAPERVGQHGFKCRYCSKVCSALRYLTQHEKVHTGGAPQSRKFKNSQVIKMPFKMKSRNGYDINEDEDEIDTQPSSSVASRYSNIHGKRHQCDICPKTFGSSGDLVRHTRTHTGEKPFECQICQKQFSRNHHLKLHQESVHAEEAFVTPTDPEEEAADEEFPELPLRIKSEPLSDDEGMAEYSAIESELYPDPAAAEEDNLNQDDVNNFYTETSTFQHNESMEGDEMDQMNYMEASESMEELDGEGGGAHQCQFCSKLFITINDLRRHEVTHTGAEQYMCGVCNSTFSNEESLISHSLIHSGE